MEESRKRKRSKVATATRLDRFLSRSGDDDGAGAGRDDSPKRFITSQDKRVYTGDGGRRVLEVSGGQGGQIEELLLGTYDKGCLLMARFTEGYPCAYCRGGLDYNLCSAIRGRRGDTE